MKIKTRQYNYPGDFKLVSDFLIQGYQPDNLDGNWFQPTWEYMHSHPYLDESSLDRIRIWEEGGEIAAVVNYESVLGEAFFQLHPNYSHLRMEMLDYAEEHLSGESETGDSYLHVYVNDFDSKFLRLVKSRGYERVPDRDRPISKFPILDHFPEIELPEGFRLKSLEEDNDLRKVNGVLWRGFEHEGKAPEEGIEGKKKMQSTPNYRKDLNIVVEAPDGTFVSYGGIWFEPTNRIAYVEPVATDPDYRLCGLGKAAVLEGIRRCGELGAKVAYVGTDKPFYLALGFERIYNSQCWIKYFAN